jgi:hypothetical protein
MLTQNPRGVLIIVNQQRATPAHHNVFSLWVTLVKLY